MSSFPATVRAQTFDVLYGFTQAGLHGHPNAPLLQASDGSFYGVTADVGTGGYGAVFRMDSSGNLEVLHSFIGTGTDGAQPEGGLILATDGSFYGTTTAGGASGRGTVFKIDTSGNLTTLHSFSLGDGAYPFAGLIQASDGNFYGTTYQGGAGGLGTVFKMDSAGNLTTLHSFGGSPNDGGAPYAGLIQATDGDLYGTTQGGGLNNLGAAFKIDFSGSLTILHSFSGTDGTFPYASLIQATDGHFYGTTYGIYGAEGSIFKMDAAGNVTTLHTFTNAGGDGANPYAALVQAADGDFYGTTLAGGGFGSYGTVFQMDSAGNVATLHSFTNSGGEGAQPVAALIQASDGDFFGTTSSGTGGTCYGFPCGSIFKVDSLGSLTTLYSFSSSDGYEPSSDLMQATDGSLFGTTSGGGVYGLGTVFKMTTSGILTTLHSFAGADGNDPMGGLTQAADGNFYGTTSFGGASGYGTVFRIDSAGDLTTLHSFGGMGIDGAEPQGGLIQATDGNLYGTTVYGGSGGCTNGCGTVFRMDSSGNLTTLHNFDGSDGAGPDARLWQAGDGNLYGTTNRGGASGCSFPGCGTIFRIDLSGNMTTLYSFGWNDGANPIGGLTFASDGNLYGTTAGGGANGYGTVFKIGLSGTLTTLHDFSGSDGTTPYADLVQGSDGNFYGTTGYGGNSACGSGCGTVFKMDSSGNLTTLHNFDDVEGANPYGGVIQAADGSLYGATYAGGVTEGGILFRLDLCLPPVASCNGPVCAGQTLQLSAFPSAGATYSWTGPNGFASTLQAPAIPNVTAADAGTYTVTVTAGACAPAQATVNVAVNAGSPPAPVITTSLCVPANTSGLTAAVTAIAGDVYNWSIFGGTIDSGQGTNAITFTSGEAGTQVRLSMVESNGSCSGSDTKLIQVDFADVPAANPFHSFICTIARNGVTAGCGAGGFCPISSVLRSQMGVFLLRGEHGSAYVPPAAAGIFGDVLASNPFAPWIEQLYREGITGGCNTNPLLYCPTNPVSRAGMAVFLLVAQHGTGYTPPACTGIFTDVACPGAFTGWIEQLYNEGISGGCNTNPLQYCPGDSVTRVQMAVFLTAAFALQ